MRSYSSPTVLVLAALTLGGCDGGSQAPPASGRPAQTQSATTNPAPEPKPAGQKPVPTDANPAPTGTLPIQPRRPIAATDTGAIKLRPNFAAAPPARDGVELEAIAPAELNRTSLDVDPFTAEANFVFTRPATAAGAPAVSLHLSVKLHDDVARAQAWLLAKSKTVAGKLTPATEPMPCDLGFVANDANGGLAYALLCRSNVTCVARVVGAGAASEITDAALRSTLTSWAKAIDASPELEAGVLPSRPSLGTIGTADVARAGHPAMVSVPVDPAGPQASSFAYEASDGASLVASKLGPMLYASKPGLVKVRVAAATGRLGCSVGEGMIQVGGD